MLGKKVLTYSRRKPFSYELNSKSKDDGNVGNVSLVDQFKAKDKKDSLYELSNRIKELDIEIPPATPKFRKSDIRPRLSIAPSQLEYNSLLQCCGQVEEMSFEEWLTATKCDYPNIEKIGESSFSEVLKLSCGNGEIMATKIMPLLRPEDSVDAKNPDRSPESIPIPNLLHEIESLRALESLRIDRKYAVPSEHTGFNRLVHCMLVAGKYPDELLQVWDVWQEHHETFNDRPDFYKDNSLHIIVTMEFGGVSLEHFRLTSMAQIHAILGQILSSISLAEEKIEFEHRDLHLDNILIQETHRTDIRLGNYLCIPTASIFCNIIDCSLARYKRDITAPRFRNLGKDEWLFRGDATESKQYQLYRDMKKLVKDDWEGFHPETNLLWISYIAAELLQRYSKFAKKEKRVYDLLSEFVTQLGTYKSSKEALHFLLKLKIN